MLSALKLAQKRGRDGDTDSDSVVGSGSDTSDDDEKYPRPQAGAGAATLPGNAKKPTTKQRRVTAKADKPKFVTEGEHAPRPPAPPVTYPDFKGDLWLGALWSVPVASIPAADLDKHLQALTCEPNKGKKQYTFNAVQHKFHIGKVVGQRLYMPCWYARQVFPNAVPTRNAYTRGEAMREEVRFTGKIFSHPPQQQAVAAYHAHVKANPLCSGCIVSLPCGYGKTVWFLYVAALLKRVTLVLVHKLPLVDQWIEEARRFMPACRAGYITADSRRIEGVDLIVASTQSLFSHIEKREPYVARLFERVGLVCMDEGHHAVASTFSRVFNACPALYRIVLTATPRRKDGLMPQLQLMAGPVIFRAFRQVGEVHVVNLQYVSDEFPDLYRGKILQSAEMVNRLSKDPGRNDMACEIMRVLVAQGRRILVVTPRVDQITVLAEAMRALLAPSAATLVRKVSMFVKDKPPAKRRRRKDETPEQAAALADEARWAWEDAGPHGSVQEFDTPLVGTVMSGMGQLERELQYEATVVIATSDMMDEGISYKQWDTLLDLDNMADCEQVDGRIFRTCPEKKVPLVVDVWMDGNMFAGSFWKRHAYYKQEGFSRRFIKASGVADLPDPAYWDAFDRPAPAVM